MKFESAQRVVHEIDPFAVLLRPIEGTARSLNRQCRYVESPAVGRNGRNARSDTRANVPGLTEPLHHCVDLLSIRALRIKGGLCVIERYENFLG